MYFLGAMLALGLLIPDHFLPWPSFRHDVLVGIGFSPLIICTAWGKVSIPKVAFFPIFLSMVPLFQIAVGQVEFSGDGWISWLYILSAALSMISATNLVGRSTLKNPLQELQPIVIALVGAAILSVGVSLAQWLKLDLFPEFVSATSNDLRFGANLAQPNQFATLLLIGLAGNIFLFENKALSKFPGILLAVFLLFGLVLTQSRMIFLAFLFASALYFGLQRQACIRVSRKAILLFAGFFFLASIAWPLINDVLLLRVPVSMLERTTTDVRLNLWIGMIEAISRSPWFGYGWGQVSVAQQAVALEYPPSYAVFESAHNIFLDIAICAGLPMALAFSLWLFLWFKRQITNCRDPLSFSILLAVGVIFCHAMVEYPLAYAYILLPTCFFMGALSRREIFAANGKAVGIFVPTIFAGASVVALAGFIIVTCEYIRFEDDWRRLRFSLAKIGTPQEFDHFRPKFLTQLREYAEFAKTKPERNMAERKLLWMKKISERFGQPSVLTKYAVAAALNGKPEAAAQSIKLVCKTQLPRICNQVVNDWEAVSLDPNYPELSAVDVATFAAKR